MNLLQTLMAAANAQARSIIQEAFTIAGDSTIYYGTFGDPVMQPIMTPNGYQDHLVIPLKAEKAQFSGTLPVRFELTRTQTIMQGATHCDFRFVKRPARP